MEHGARSGNRGYGHRSARNGHHVPRRVGKNVPRCPRDDKRIPWRVGVFKSFFVNCLRFEFVTAIDKRIEAHDAAAVLFTAGAVVSSRLRSDVRNERAVSKKSLPLTAYWTAP